MPGTLVVVALPEQAQADAFQGAALVDRCADAAGGRAVVCALSSTVDEQRGGICWRKGVQRQQRGSGQGGQLRRLVIGTRLPGAAGSTFGGQLRRFVLARSVRNCDPRTAAADDVG